MNVQLVLFDKNKVLLRDATNSVYTLKHNAWHKNPDVHVNVRL